jgi:leucyl/phenylalanyl-tRNA---protein transferase
LHHSLKRTLKKFLATPGCEVRVDHDFAAVIAACAATPRAGQGGTWIVPEMQDAYTALHRAGYAHSVETWVHGQLVGGLYCTAFGQAVFGESMFSRATDASKIALCALVALCRAQGAAWVDCQQNTAHLASLGAAPVARKTFVDAVQRATAQPALDWRMNAVYWEQLLSQETPNQS